MYEIHMFIISYCSSVSLIDKHVTQTGISVLVSSLQKPFTFLSV